MHAQATMMSTSWRPSDEFSALALVPAALQIAALAAIAARGRGLSWARWLFAANIPCCIAWSYFGPLSKTLMCGDDGAACVAFTGLTQFSTFTRWSFLLQGVYFVLASLGLPRRVTTDSMCGLHESEWIS